MIRRQGTCHERAAIMMISRNSLVAVKGELILCRGAYIVAEEEG
jgi:hypothetical protein